MPDGVAPAKTPARPRRKLNFRPWLRAFHRDIGYFAVGLTVVYATSGLAVNHLKDWDPNFKQVNRSITKKVRRVILVFRRQFKTQRNFATNSRSVPSDFSATDSILLYMPIASMI